MAHVLRYYKLREIERHCFAPVGVKSDRTLAGARVYWRARLSSCMDASSGPRDPTLFKLGDLRIRVAKFAQYFDTAAT